MEKKNYYLGLDIGTNSVGYAVTDKQYNLLKYKGEPMWGAHIFEEGKQCAERRSFRTSRRRLNRKQQRVQLVQELFANEIAKVDERFFVRLNESALYREDTSGNDPYIFFNDKEYNDKHYFREYPTIHHLIMSLIEEDKMHDIRLVYMAVAWIVAHRGHFLNEVDKSNVDKILDFENTYNRLCEYYNANGFNIPWKDDIEGFKEVLLEKCGVRKKEELFKEKLFGGAAYKNSADDFISAKEVFTLLSGGTVSADKLFLQDEFEEKINISFKKSEEEFQVLLGMLDDYSDFLLRLKEVYDWSLLYEASGGNTYISKAKIE
ncbi:MAG: type II CRISPR RNA-guided endonuclease Cas9, partial [Lachnospiraceae bacterium]